MQVHSLSITATQDISVRSIDWAESAALLESGACLISANNRLARRLQQRCGEQRPQAVWDKPNIYSWHAWLLTQYQQLVRQGLAEAMPLTALQENLLWEEIAEEWQASTTAATHLLQCNNAARDAARAWRSVQDWRVSQSQLDSYRWHSETRLLLQWANTFEHHCKQRQLISITGVNASLLQHCAQLALQEPTQLILAGFDSLTPLQQELLAALTQQGWTLMQLELGVAQSTCETLTLPSAADELDAAASWAAQYLATYPQARISIIVPDLQQRLGQVERVFRQHEQPGARNSAFHLSLGRPLAQQAMVQDALLLLRLCFRTLDADQLTRLLHSPWIGKTSVDLSARVRFDLCLRKLGRLTHSLPSLLEDAAKHSDETQLPFFVQLHALQAQLGAQAITSYGAFSSLCSQLLQIAGWPGEQSLNSHDYQVHQAFSQLFDMLSLFDRIGFSRASIAGMLRRLQQLARDTAFQPNTGQCAIQIMGMLEAIGQESDALWVCGMTANNWPPSAQPNPMLPLQLQRELGMPRSNAENELALAQRMTKRLQQSASTVIFSYAETEGDSKLEISTLLKHLPQARAPQPTEQESPRSIPNTVLESLNDLRAPVFHPTAEKTKGGTDLLEKQSLCPFQAFASYRLKAEAPERPAPGMNALVRGAFMHSCLEQFWHKTKNSATLAAFSAEQLHSAISTAVKKACDKTHLADHFSAALIAIECARAESLLHEWLAIDQQRPAFSTLAVEEDLSVQLGSLTLATRIDRIDQLADGTHLIIDYKSSKPKTLRWLQARPEEPQLPLYAAASPLAISAIAFGFVRTGNCTLKGLAAAAELIGTGVESKDDWQALRDQWHAQLNSIANEFVEGRADPTPTPRACQYCKLTSLCRKDDGRDFITDTEDAALMEDEA